MAEQKRLRVAQWATGNVGSRALRTVIEHPGLELVALHVHSPEKEGKDAGDLAGLPPTGVKATRTVEEIVALAPDAVLYMQQDVGLDDVCKLLASGVNIVTTRGEFHNPRQMDPTIRERIEAACRVGNSSIHSTGCSPGWITEVMPLVLTSLNRRLDGIVIDEYANLGLRPSPEMIFNIMGYAKTREEFAQRRKADGLEGFAHSLDVLLTALGLNSDGFDIKTEVAVARNEVQILAGTIPKDTVAAQRVVVNAKVDGEPFALMRINWYASKDIEEDWELGDNGWRVQIKGDTPLDVRIGFPVPYEDYPTVMPGLTAHLPVNTIPYVVAADPGILTSLDLPRVVPHFGQAPPGPDGPIGRWIRVSPSAVTAR